MKIKEIGLTEDPINQTIDEKLEVIRFKINEIIRKINYE